jgi:putative SOS response-associated peptidase YedK
MCGRYTVTVPAEALEARFQAQASAGLVSPSYNAAPSHGLPVILNTEPRVMTLSHWGFVPEWAAGKPDVKPLINARAETAASKPYFRDAFRSKRCLVLADGFYEWKRTGKRKTPYRIAFKTNEPFAFAGLWSTVHDAQGRPRTTFAVLTTDANPLVARLHPRMPAILRPQDEAIWLDPLLLPEQAQTLLEPYPAGLLHAYPVSTRVNSPAWNSPQALASLPQDAARESMPDHIPDLFDTPVSSGQAAGT